jgi:preprotein translocase subunit YajC
MLMTTMGSGGCSVFGMAGGLLMMALPLIAIAAVIYLVFARPQNSTQ